MLDLVIRNLRVVRPRAAGVETLDVGVAAGKFAEIASSIDPRRARKVVDGRGLLAFPGLVDAHTHVGIYHPLERDAENESRAAAAGGVTTLVSYMRTGQYYLDRGGSYTEFLPEVLRRSEGRYEVDYAYHLAPITRRHIGEIEMLRREYGVASFKIFMFYGGHGLHGRSDSQREFLKLEEGDSYDIAHFESVMRAIAAMNDRHVSLSLHCEIADILNAYTAMVQKEGKLTGLAAYSAARPQHSEGLAIFIAGYLADETRCPRINLLHLTSKKAIEAALTMRRVFPHVDIGAEATIGHLLLDIDCKAGVLAKVNPPIRPREDVERLWQAVLAGDVDWIVSDHACCSREHKVARGGGPESDVFSAKAGFGGTEYLLTGLLSEGKRRGLSLNRVAELTSHHPAQRFALYQKGDIAVGYDADLALVDDTVSFVVGPDTTPSAQGYSPFDGLTMTAKVVQTWLRGELVWDDGRAVGPRRGRYLARPYGASSAASTEKKERG
jgi:allantoinase